MTASRVEQDLAQRACVDQRHLERNHPELSGSQYRRPAPHGSGVNVTQLSARDINLTSRAATGTLATSQLALVDGRTIYLDFFGMVMWDLVSANTNEIRQIEVIRGPASAVWGANAMSGVVNVITKTPRQLAAEGPGTFTIGLGSFDRNVDGRDGQDAGVLFSVNAAHAQALDARWSYKVSAGYLTQVPLARPAGRIPNAFQTPYPPFTNSGTTQPKFDTRVDYDLPAGGVLSFAGGVAGTEGIIYTGIGPFDVVARYPTRVCLVPLRARAAQRVVLHEHPERQGSQPCGLGARRPAASTRLRDAHVRHRSNRFTVDRRPAPVELRRKLSS